tara:strand:+ start:1830 stop:2060 length:231 start_codon:yes stop_codon:yes gene_type:complete
MGKMKEIFMQEQEKIDHMSEYMKQGELADPSGSQEPMSPAEWKKSNNIQNAVFVDEIMLKYAEYYHNFKSLKKMLK